MMQPWFHSGMTREQAASLVAKHGTVDGWVGRSRHLKRKNSGIKKIKKFLLIFISLCSPSYRVFLVRDSQSSPGAFVLTLKFGAKVLHKEITPMSNSHQDTICYTLDNGQTKFYDLLQLIEFYQLNMGSLPTRLTHYLVQSPTGVLYKEKSRTREAPGSFWQCPKPGDWQSL